MTQTRIPAAAAMIRAVEWSDYELRDGQATNFDGTLLRFLSDDRPSQRDRLWFTMEESVFSQGYVFSAAEPTIAVLLASLLDDLADPVRIAVLDLLFLLRALFTKSPSEPEEFEPGDYPYDVREFGEDAAVAGSENLPVLQMGDATFDGGAA